MAHLMELKIRAKEQISAAGFLPFSLLGHHEPALNYAANKGVVQGDRLCRPVLGSAIGGRRTDRELKPVKQVRVVEGSETVDVVPLYHKVYTILSQQIREGLYNETTPLPGEQQLAAQYSVSRVTVRKALQRLEEEGRITRQRGRGTFPTSVQPVTRRRKLIDQLTITHETEAEIRSFEWMQVTPDAAAGLKVPVGTQALRVVRLRRTGRTPFALGVVWISPETGALIDRENIESDSIIEFLRDNGNEFDRVEQRITATVADAPSAEILKVDPGSPLLLVNRQVFNIDGSIAMHIRTLYRPDRYAYLVTVRPEPDNLAPRWVEIE